MITAGFQQDLGAAGRALLLTLVIGACVGAAARWISPLGTKMVLPVADFHLCVPPIVAFFVGFLPLRVILATILAAYVGAGEAVPCVIVVLLCWPAYARLAHSLASRMLMRSRAGLRSNLLSLATPATLLVAQLILDLWIALLIVGSVGAEGLGVHDAVNSIEWGAEIYTALLHGTDPWWVVGYPLLCLLATSLLLGLVARQLRSVLSPVPLPMLWPFHILMGSPQPLWHIAELESVS
jgi:ABC-type dipeptide/oligopeptide/nickel transport system permease subunit